MYRLEPGGSEHSAVTNMYSLYHCIFIGGPHSVYRLEPGGSEHSAVTNMYSMSTPASR